MVATLPAKLAKIILFAFNATFWVCGLALIITGIVFLVDKNAMHIRDVMSNADATIQAVAYLMLALGGFMFLIGFCGCCGAMRESKCLLGTYVALLIGLIIAKIVMVVFVAVKKDVLENSVASQFKLLVDAYPPPDKWDPNKPDPVRITVDIVQYKLLKCCGTKGKHDWLDSNFYKSQTKPPFKTVPPSCCTGIYIDDEKYNDPLYQTCAVTNIPPAFNTGCQEKIVDWIRASYALFMALLATIAAIELVGIILALCVYFNIRDAYNQAVGAFIWP